MSTSFQTTDVIDLSLDSSVSPPSIARRRRGAAPTTPPQQQQRRYPTRTRKIGNDATVNGVSNNSNAAKTNRGAVESPKKVASREVIVLDDEDDGISPKSPSSTGTPGNRRGRRCLLGNDDDDDDIEIISTSAAAKGGDIKLSGDKYWIERIREVFPFYRRADIAFYLSSAKTYVSTTLEKGDDKDECAFRTVMTVLAEEDMKCMSTSTSPVRAPKQIPDARFAAAAIGGRVEISGEDSAASSRRKTALLECQCCFVEYDFKVMISCRSGGHLFCMECLRKHTEQRVFGIGNFGSVRGNMVKPQEAENKKALEILCMASGCVSGFDDRVLSKALPKKVLHKYDELRYKANIANMPDVSTCPKCNFTAAIINNHAAFHPSIQLPPTHLLFHCPQCRFKSCRSCHEEYHPNIARCDLVESKTEASGRNKVEEAMTLALVRICPRNGCRKKFLKSDGCNKMTCPCGCLVCNVCRVEIPANVAYNHFCQT